MRPISEEQMASIRAGVKSVMSRKLTEDQVREIRGTYSYRAGHYRKLKYGAPKIEDLGLKYGVGETTVRAVIKRETWRHL